MDEDPRHWPLDRLLAKAEAFAAFAAGAGEGSPLKAAVIRELARRLREATEAKEQARQEADESDPNPDS